MRMELPEVTAKRGGIRYGEVPPQPPKPPFVPPAPPEGETTETGYWNFGARLVDEDGDETIFWSEGVWSPETFNTPDQVRQAWGHEENMMIVRRWMRRPLPWEPHTESS